MLQPEELRINNLVSVNEIYRNEGDLLELNQKNFESLIINETYRRIFPIPISKEWFRNFKFADGNEFENTRGRWTKKKFAIMKTDWAEEESTWNLISTPNGDLTYWRHGKIPHIQYVHQLQNLFYALTGEELTLNK